MVVESTRKQVRSVENTFDKRSARLLSEMFEVRSERAAAAED